jgi:hypothetical protein
LLNKDVEDGIVESGVGGMAVRFPTTIREVELDRAAKWVAAVNSNGGVAKIGTSFAIPSAELDDLDLVAGDRSEAPTEIAGEPARLELELAGSAEVRKEGAFVNAGGITKLGVSSGEQHLGGGSKAGGIDHALREQKAPNPKLQPPEKFQTSSSKRKRRLAVWRLGAWCLVLLWSLELGIWSFS